MFDKQWFSKHQKLLLRFANNFIGRYILRINGKRSSVGKNKIIKIDPNSITWKGKKKKEFVTEFRCGNKFANRIRTAFYPIWYLFHLWDTLFANNFQPDFNLGFDSLTAYSGAGDGSTTNSNASWATCRSAASAGYYVQYTDGSRLDAVSSDQNGGTYYIGRSFFPIDTSSLTASATISAATFSIYAAVQQDLEGATIGVVQTSQSSTSEIVAEDYDQVGSTDGATRIDLTSWSTGSYQDFNLNATGLTWIDKSGFTKLGCRTNLDIDNTTPGSLSQLFVYFSEAGGTSQDPKLVVTYTLPTGGYIFISS